MYIYQLYAYRNCFLICFNSWLLHKSGHKCFDTSGPFLQIRSHIDVHCYTDTTHPGLISFKYDLSNANIDII